MSDGVGAASPRLHDRGLPVSALGRTTEERSELGKVRRCARRRLGRNRWQPSRRLSGRQLTLGRWLRLAPAFCDGNPTNGCRKKDKPTRRARLRRLLAAIGVTRDIEALARRCAASSVAPRHCCGAGE